MTNCLWTMGDNNGAVESGERALAIAEALDDRALVVQARFYLSHPCFGRGDYQQAAALLQQNQEALTGDLLTERFGLHHLPSVTSRGWLAVCLAEMGDFGAAIATGDEGVRIAEAADHPFSLIVALGGLGRAQATQGDFEVAIPVLARGLRLCELWDIPLLSGWLAPTLGYAYARVGEVAQGLAVLEEGPWATPAGNQVCNLAWLAEVDRLAGRADVALTRAQSALEYAREHGERGRAAWVLHLLAEFAARAGTPDVDQAERYYHQAVTLADELGMRPLVAHCHLGLGTLYHKIGHDEQAQTELATATEVYRAMEMTFWLARAETELGQIASAP